MKTLSDKRHPNWKPRTDIKGWYLHDDVKEAIRKTLLDNKKHCNKHDKGYEEFERGYRIAINHCRLNILSNFGDALHENTGVKN